MECGWTASRRTSGQHDEEDNGATPDVRCGTTVSFAAVQLLDVKHLNGYRRLIQSKRVDQGTRSDANTNLRGAVGLGSDSTVKHRGLR